MRPKRKNISFLWILLAACLWGTAGLFVRTAKSFSLSEMQLVLLRALFSCLVIALILLVKDRSLFCVKVKDLWLFAGAGIFSIVLFNFCYYNTMALTSLSVAAVLLYTAPFFVVILSVFLFREKLTLRKCGACMTAFLGCCLVTGVFSTDTAIGSKAILFGILTGFGYSLYTIFGRLLLDRKYSIWTITFYTFVFAFCGCLPFVDPVKTVVLAVSSGEVFLNTALMALLNTVFPYLLYTVGLRGVSPSTAPIIAMAEPVVATLVGALCFHETITLAGAAGIGLVIASVAILNGRREQQHGSSDRDGLCEN